MNAFPAGSHVSFFNSIGGLVTGVVQSTSRMSDGTLIVVIIKRDNGGAVTLPIDSPADSNCGFKVYTASRMETMSVMVNKRTSLVHSSATRYTDKDLACVQPPRPFLLALQFL
ncbi:hypothetical protein ARMGADRAFT_1143002 [Armillaria gallica]|uniref:Uncharacterized protein n=1 Tax=Armillaria gallica TaxID=47427 RepID=A0A2H3DZI4_ARMGA|nr:hypothetical protein ARMGADRAFT_1143002 [Armillaria gallica]